MPVETTNISTLAHPTVAQAIYQCVAETAVTTMMAQNFHWNVTGMAFGPLHALFQEIYEDHFQAQDELAERIRSIGYKVDGRLSAMIDISLSLIHIRRCRRSTLCRSRWSPYH